MTGQRVPTLPTSVRRILKLLLAAIVMLMALPYLRSPLFRFPEPDSFRGSRLWNPYAGLRGTWQRANFHAHGRAWSGLTNGRQSGEQVAQYYRDLGYSVPGVSDYQRIAAFHGVPTIPAYEHGYNIGKQHQIAIGARAVEWWDVPLWQSLSHQQFIIDRVKRKADLVALAHPVSRQAYTPDDLQRLTGYDLIEIVNGPFAMPEVWDAALSSGHPVWAIANDDTHDLEDLRRRAVAWNMIDAETASTQDIVDALRAGRSYAVLRTGALDAAGITILDRVDIQDATMIVSVRGAAATFRFIGQNGAVRQTVKNTSRASYAFLESDTYVRTVIESPQTVLYLNPVLRYDGKTFPGPVAIVDTASTWAFRGALGLGTTLFAFAYTRRRRSAIQPAARAVPAGAKRNTA